MPIRAPGAAVALGGQVTASVELEIDCPQRGFFELGPVQSAASDPLGLFRLKLSSGSSERLIVHPATVDLPGFVLLPADLPGEGPVHIRSQHVTTSAFSIRDYVPGDSLNRISWKSTARHGRLMVKEFEVEPAQQHLDHRRSRASGECGPGRAGHRGDDGHDGRLDLSPL